MNKELNCMNCCIGDFKDSLCDCNNGMCKEYKKVGKAEDFENEVLNRTKPKTEWIPVSERLPKCEQEVLICTEKKLVGKDACIDSIVTPAIYEDGTMLEVESMWSWYDMDFDEWDDAEDCGIIPMGWFENRHFNPDEVYNNPVDRKVVAWMPLPEPYREDGKEAVAQRGW